MTWNYRIVRHRTRGHVWYGLHECYYKKNGKLYLWSTDEEVAADTKADIVRILALMLRDATRSDMPTMNMKDMPGNTTQVVIKGKKK